MLNTLRFELYWQAASAAATLAAVRAAAALGLLTLSEPAAFAYGPTPIYGTHFYGSGEESTIKNSKVMWSVEQIYTKQYTNPVAEKAKIQDIVNKGFKVLLRLDYEPGATVPPNWDWNKRYDYAAACGSIAGNMGNLVSGYIIGNEMTQTYEGNIDKQWYTICYNSQDTNCAYDKIKAAWPSAPVLTGALPGWPGTLAEPNSNLTYFKYIIDNAEAVDGVCVHAYSGTKYFNDANSGTEDPRFSDMTGLKSFGEYAKLMYAKWGPWKPLYITETNTYWFKNGFSCYTYRDDWTKEAFQTIDEWNASNDQKVDALVWFTYSHFGITDPNSDIWGNALMRTDNAKLNRARTDFSWVTANTNMTAGYPGSTIKIQAENFNNSDLWNATSGIAGVDYSDTTTGNAGGVYRTDANVDISYLPDYSGFAVGWMVAGEWLHYGSICGNYNYKWRIRYARGATGTGQVRFKIDGTQYGPIINLPTTGNWNTYTTAINATAFSVPPGAHTIRLEAVTGDFNVDYFELVKQ